MAGPELFVITEFDCTTTEYPFTALCNVVIRVSHDKLKQTNAITCNKQHWNFMCKLCIVNFLIIYQKEALKSKLYEIVNDVLVVAVEKKDISKLKKICC